MSLEKFRTETDEIPPTERLRRALSLEDFVELGLGEDAGSPRVRINPAELHDGDTKLVDGLADRLVGHF